MKTSMNTAIAFACIMAAQHIFTGDMPKSFLPTTPTRLQQFNTEWAIELSFIEKEAQLLLDNMQERKSGLIKDIIKKGLSKKLSPLPTRVDSEENGFYTFAGIEQQQSKSGHTYSLSVGVFVPLEIIKNCSNLHEFLKKNLVARSNAINKSQMHQYKWDILTEKGTLIALGTNTQIPLNKREKREIALGTVHLTKSVHNKEKQSAKRKHSGDAKKITIVE